MKEQKWSASSIAAMIIVTLIYAGFSSLVVILLKTDLLNPFISKIFGLKTEIEGIAYSYVFAFYILTFIPTFILYLLYQSPLPIKQKPILIIFSILALLAVILLDILFFSRFKILEEMNRNLIFEIILKISLISSQVFFLLEYIILLVDIDEGEKPQKEGEGIKATCSYIFKNISWGIVHLKNDYPNVYIIICTIFCFLVGLVIVGIFIIIMGLISLALTPIGIIYLIGRKSGEASDSSSSKSYTFTNSMGCNQTVYSDNGRDFYDSQGAYVGHSDDGGNTINDD
jgi:hypothetical protein